MGWIPQARIAAEHLAPESTVRTAATIPLKRKGPDSSGAFGQAALHSRIGNWSDRRPSDGHEARASR